MSNLCAEIIQSLKSRGAWIAAAESCTGGMILDELTHVPGSSQVVWGGWVTYDQSAKESQLGVPSWLIAERGMVSREVAEAMAQGGLIKLQASKPHTGLSVCVATTGAAGPTGSPVGLCWAAISWSHSGKHGLSAWEIRAPSGLDRAGNKRFFAEAVLKRLRSLET